MIPNYDAVFKHNFEFQKKISAQYAKQALVFQQRHKQRYPHQRIWRHLLYRRTFYFLLDGRQISIQIELVRFRYVETNHTFTFYGTLFCSYSHFSAGFIRQATSKPANNLASLCVSQETVRRWRSWLSTGLTLPITSKKQQDHKPDYGLPLSSVG